MTRRAGESAATAGDVLASIINARDAEIRRLRAALVTIRDDPHQEYGMGEYCLGVADGHRCAAGKAREALEAACTTGTTGGQGSTSKSRGTK